MTLLCRSGFFYFSFSFLGFPFPVGVVIVRLFEHGLSIFFVVSFVGSSFTLRTSPLSRMVSRWMR